ncbi:MAG: type II toxin-antitoxin system VapC family toxin [Candidatus Sulfotelmatobacter sp.]|jgi:predicted nucleic-acid-binding protein
MIGLDTNILVRFITQDHPAQTAAATRLIDSLSSDAPGYLSLIVIAELIWVLQFSYRFDKQEIEKVIERLLRSKELILEKKDTVAQALTKFRTSRADFADCLIERCGRSAGCQHVLTFDKNAAASGMRLLSS